MRLCDTYGNVLRPEPGSKVLVAVGAGSTRRETQGQVVRTTPTQIIVRYKPNLKSDREVEARFHKKSGAEVGIGYFWGAPRVYLPGAGD